MSFKAFYHIAILDAIGSQQTRGRAREGKLAQTGIDIPEFKDEHLSNIPGANTSAYTLGFGLEARYHPFFLQSDLLEDLRQLHISNGNTQTFLIPLGSSQW